MTLAVNWHENLAVVSMVVYWLYFAISGRGGREKDLMKQLTTWGVGQVFCLPMFTEVAPPVVD